MSLPRTVAAFLLVVPLLGGCLTADAVLSPAPDVAVENRADAEYTVTATVVHTDDRLDAVPVELTYADGRTERIPFGEHGVGNDFNVPPNVTAVRAAGDTSTPWTVELAPGAAASTQLERWEDNDVVLLAWTRTADGIVTRVTTIPCRSAGAEYHGHVDTSRGSGGATTSC